MAWEVGSTRGYANLNGVQVRDAKTGLVVAVAIGDVPELDAKATARLIASAPNMKILNARLCDRLEDLADLLKHALKTPGYGKDQNSREEVETALEQARDLLDAAKATGAV